MSRVNVYIEGFNLYFGLRSAKLNDLVPEFWQDDEATEETF